MDGLSRGNGAFRCVSWLAIVVLSLPLAKLRAGDTQPPGWSGLPENTLLVARLPSLAAFADAFAQQTRLGAAMSDPQRWQSALTYLLRQRSIEWETIQQGLAAYDLKLDDW